MRIADASRILSIGGDVTEIIYALGAGNRIVAVDTTSQFPETALKEKKNVGYMRALSSEGCLSVDATVIFASERSGPPEVVKSLKATSVPYVEIPDQYSAQGIVAKVRLIARAIGADAEADKLATQVDGDFAALAANTAKIKRRVRVLFVLGVQNGRVSVGGLNTSADAILKLAGADNVATHVNGFRPLPDEAIVELAPEVIVGHAPYRQRYARPRSAACAQGRSIDAGGDQQAHYRHGWIVSPGVRSARAGRRARSYGQALP